MKTGSREESEAGLTEADGGTDKGSEGVGRRKKGEGQRSRVLSLFVGKCRRDGSLVAEFLLIHQSQKNTINLWCVRVCACVCVFGLAYLYKNCTTGFFFSTTSICSWPLLPFVLLDDVAVQPRDTRQRHATSPRLRRCIARLAMQRRIPHVLKVTTHWAKNLDQSHEAKSCQRQPVCG